MDWSAIQASVGPNLPVVGSAPKGINPQIDKAAQDFEAVFVTQMVQLMMEQVEVDENFGGGHGEEMFRGVLSENIGKEISRGSGIGLSDVVREQLLKLQSGQS